MRSARNKPTTSCAFSRVIALFVSYALALVSCQATTYYVDSTNGSDSNSGTSPSSAWLTLTNPNDNTHHPLHAGDTLSFICGGVWSGELTIVASGTSTAPITINSYPNPNNPSAPKPLINGGGGVGAAIFLSGSINYVTVEGLSVTNYDGSNITDGVEGNRCGILVGTYGNTQNNITIYNNEIYYVEGFSNSPSVGSPRGTTLAASSNNQYSCAALYARGSQMNNMTVSDNYLHDCTGTGLYILPNVGSPSACQGLLVEGNTVSNVGDDGIEILNSASPVIEYNICLGVGNNSNGGTWPVAGYVGFHGLAVGGMWSEDCSNVLFQYNYCEGTHQIKYDGEAWDFDFNLSGTCIYQYNFSRNNGGGFMLSTHTSQTSGLTMIARFNISVNDGVTQGAGEGFFNDYVDQYDNNIFYRTDGQGFMLKGSSAPYAGTWDNNIFYTTATSNITYASSTSLFNNNCFYGHTPVSPGTSPVLSNPLFVNATSAAAGTSLTSEGGFQLQEGSPCLNTGVALSSNGGFDYWGNAIASTFNNIGVSGLVKIVNGTYSFTPSALPAFLMDAYHAGGAGSIVDMNASNGGSSQKWSVTSLGGSVYEISPSYNTALAVTTSGTSSGSLLSLGSYAGLSTQQWTFTPNTNGTIQLTPLNAATQLASAPDSGGNGTQLVTETLGGNYAQNWLVEPPGFPTILTQPAALTVPVGQAATFSVVSSGTSPLTYQWQKNGVNITGATSSSYSIASVAATDLGNYSVVVSNSLGSATSTSASLVPVTSSPPATAQTINIGQTVTLTVTPAGNGPYTYQWNLNGTAITGATSNAYTISNATGANIGSYTLTIMSSNGTYVSGPFGLSFPAPSTADTPTMPTWGLLLLALLLISIAARRKALPNG